MPVAQVVRIFNAFTSHLLESRGAEDGTTMDIAVDLEGTVRRRQSRAL